MTVKIYGYQKCSTCRQAQKFLRDHAQKFEAIEITEQPPTVAELSAMLDHLGGNLKRLFNTSGQVYREMKLGDELPSMSKAAALKLLAGNGKLVKRPFLIVKDKPAAVGFKEAEWKDLF